MSGILYVGQSTDLQTRLTQGLPQHQMWDRIIATVVDPGDVFVWVYPITESCLAVDFGTGYSNL